MHSTSAQDPSISQLSLPLLPLKHSDPTVPELADWIPTLVEKGTLVCTMSLNTHARSHRRIDMNVSTRVRASLNRSTATHNRNCQRCILDLFLQIWERWRAFHAFDPLLGTSLAFVLAWVSTTSCVSCFWPRLPSARSRKRARS